MIKSTTISGSQWFYLQIYQNIGATATSTGSYIDMYLSPKVIISTSFNQNNDCQIFQNQTVPSYNSNTCLVSIVQTSTYVRLTIQANATYLSTISNLFPYQSFTYIRLKNMAFPLTSSNKNVYPLYLALYQSNVVNPITYYYSIQISCNPPYNNLAGVNFKYVSNMYSTSGNTNFQTYPGVVRL